MVLVTSTVWNTVTCGAVNALVTIASAVRLRTDFTGTRVWRPSGVTAPDASQGWSSSAYVASGCACARSWWACTSSRVTMPPGPVPATLARSTPRSLASLRTGGFARTGRCTWAAGALVRVAARGAGAGAGGARGGGRAAGAGAGGAVAAGAAGAGSAARRRRRAVPGSTVPYPTSTEPEPDAAGAAAAAPGAAGASAPSGTVAAGADG